MKNVSRTVLLVAIFFLIIEVVLRFIPHMPGAMPFKQHMLFSNDKLFLIKNGVISQDHFLFTRDYYLFWKVKYLGPGDFHSINTQGFRGDLILIPKPKNVFRIFVIGDSCAFGNAVKYTQAYPYYLQGLLNQPGNKVVYEVVNAGVPGYSSLQGLRHLVRDVLPYQPDLVIASFGWNDTLPAVFYTDKQQKAPNDLVMAVSNSLQHSMVFAYLDNIITSWLSKTLLSLNKKYFKSKEIARVPEADFVENLSAIEALGRKTNFKVIFLNQPARQLVTHHYDALTRKVSAQRNVPFVDLLPLFCLNGHSVEELFLDQNHYSPLGNQVIAKAIFDFLNERKLLK